MEAQVWMTGRVGSEVEYRAESGSPWATFRMACTPRAIRDGEWGDEQTTWVSVSCANRLAQHVVYSLRKGDPVIVVGKLRTNRWHDVNGIEHEQLRIRASSVGHDLTGGTSSFYRVRRDAPADADDAQGQRATELAGAEPGDDDDYLEADEHETDEHETDEREAHDHEPGVHEPGVHEPGVHEPGDDRAIPEVIEPGPGERGYRGDEEADAAA